METNTPPEEIKGTLKVKAQQNLFQEAYLNLEANNSAEAPELNWHVNAPEPDYTASQFQVHSANDISRLPDPGPGMTAHCQKSSVMNGSNCISLIVSQAQNLTSY